MIEIAILWFKQGSYIHLLHTLVLYKQFISITKIEAASEYDCKIKQVLVYCKKIQERMKKIENDFIINN